MDPVTSPGHTDFVRYDLDGRLGRLNTGVHVSSCQQEHHRAAVVPTRSGSATQVGTGISTRRRHSILCGTAPTHGYQGGYVDTTPSVIALNRRQSVLGRARRFDPSGDVRGARRTVHLPATDDVGSAWHQESEDGRHLPQVVLDDVPGPPSVPPAVGW